MNILLCTLGGSWAVIPEAFALLDPGRCPLYRDHTRHDAIEALRRRHDLRTPDELWVCTTDDVSLDNGLARLQCWRDLVDPGLPLRIWRAGEVVDVADQAANDRVRELIYRAVLRASEQTGEGGRLYLSLAGGRKTMSADLQRAGMTIGCHALLHILAPPISQMTERMKSAEPEVLAEPLSSEDCQGLLPLVVGRGLRSELLDIAADDLPPIRAEGFPLPAADDSVPVLFAGDDRSLPAEIERREREGSRLLGNFLHSLVESERHENWRTLYRLPPAVIGRLKSTPLSKIDRSALERLPKADLHRHIGGCLDLEAQRKVGQAVWSVLNKKQRSDALDRVAPLLAQSRWEWDWPERLKEGDRCHAAAALLVEADDAQLQYNLYEVTEPRRALRDGRLGFAAYERPGELSGSAVLGHPAALEPYARALFEAAQAEGVRYLELRGSPQKYRQGIEAQLGFLAGIRAVAQEFPEIEHRFVIIADRRRKETINDVVDLAVKAHERLDGYVAGLDLAGDEMQDGMDAPEEVAGMFEPAFRHCLPITVHAGEGTASEKIWKAAYRLHADRIGHGLTLADDARLLARFRDRDICIELCPSSNDEVVGFGPDRPYPLKTYWEEGLSVALCTDNPAISRTDATGELFKAAEFWPEMTLWQALAIIRQGFVHAFLPASRREGLLKKVDRAIYDWVLELGCPKD